MHLCAKKVVYAAWQKATAAEMAKRMAKVMTCEMFVVCCFVRNEPKRRRGKPSVSAKQPLPVANRKRLQVRQNGRNGRMAEWQNGRRAERQ